MSTEESSLIIGKVGRHLFDQVIFPKLGKHDPSIKTGPKFGVDISVIELGDTILIVEVDPVFVVPEYGWDRSAWFAVHILASDVVVSGVPPRYLFIDLNLPLTMTDDEFELLWTRIHQECEKLGIAIAAGHTGRYGGVDYPMIGGATMIAVTTNDRYVTPEMARPGDKIILTKGAAVETAGILATMFPNVVKDAHGASFAETAKDIFWLQTVVPDALTLAKTGIRTGVTAMHDATEYGVWGALKDVAEASNVGMTIYEDKLFVRDDVQKVIDAFSKFTEIQVDPHAAISEGTLIATVRPEKVDEALALLQKENIDAAVIGEVTAEKTITLIKKDGTKSSLPEPKQDPFWLLFFKTLDILRENQE